MSELSESTFRLVTVREFSRRTGFPLSTIYDQLADWPFTVQVTARSYRIDLNRFEEWLSQGGNFQKVIETGQREP